MPRPPTASRGWRQARRPLRASARDVEREDVAAVVADVHAVHAWRRVAAELDEVGADHAGLEEPGTAGLAVDDGLAGAAAGARLPAHDAVVLDVADVVPAVLVGDPPGLGEILAVAAGLDLGGGAAAVEAAGDAQVQLPLGDDTVTGVSDVDGRGVGGIDRDAARRAHQLAGGAAAADDILERAGAARDRQQLGLVEHLQPAACHVGSVDASALHVDALHAPREHARRLALRPEAVHEPALLGEGHHVVVVVADPDVVVAVRLVGECARVAEALVVGVGRRASAPLADPTWAAAGRRAGLVGVELLDALLERVDHVEAVGAAGRLRVVGDDRYPVLLVEPALRRRLGAGRPAERGRAGAGVLRGRVGGVAAGLGRPVVGRELEHAVAGVLHRRGGHALAGVGGAAPGVAGIDVAGAVDRHEPDRVEGLVVERVVGAVGVAPLVHEPHHGAARAGAAGDGGRVVGELVDAVQRRADGIDQVVGRVKCDPAHVAQVALDGARGDDRARAGVEHEDPARVVLRDVDVAGGILGDPARDRRAHARATPVQSALKDALVVEDVDVAALRIRHVQV